MNTSGIRKDIRDGALRLSWDNRHMQKDRFVFGFMIVFCIIWAPCIVLLTLLFFTADHWEGNLVFFKIWLIFGWLVTIAIPYTLLGRFWSEWLVVSQKKLSFGSVGFLARSPKTLLLKDIREIAIGYIYEESMVTLNVYENTKTWSGGRHILAYWLAPDLKEEIYRAIQDFVEDTKIPLKLRRND